MTEILCLGEILIDFVPTEAGQGVGNTVTWQRAAGGAPANVAVGIQQLGGRVGFLGQVGDDPFGHYLIDILQSAGVDIQGLSVTTAARTALAFVALEPNGERDFIFYRQPSADMLHGPSDIRIEQFKTAQLFHFGSISTISEPSKSATLQAITYAHQHNMLISFDPNVRLPLWENATAARQAILDLIPQAHIIKMSTDELAFLTGHADLQASEQLWHKNLRLLVITHGSDGCSYSIDQQWHHVAAPQVQAIDSTGAGDAFVAAMLSQITAEPTILEQPTKLAQLFRNACAAGAWATTQRGAIPALPYWTDINRLLQS